MGKICTLCKESKPETEYYKNAYLKSGLSSICKTCHRAGSKKYRDLNPEKVKQANRSCYLQKREERILKQKEWYRQNNETVLAAKKRRLLANPGYNRKYTLKKHGITSSEFFDMIFRQFFKCYVCGTKFLKDSEAHIDHCHKSNIIRGLLCSKCNTAIGLVGENIKTLEQMIYYLQNNKDGFKEF